MISVRVGGDEKVEDIITVESPWPTIEEVNFEGIGKE